MVARLGVWSVTEPLQPAGERTAVVRSQDGRLSYRRRHVPTASGESNPRPPELAPGCSPG